MSETPKSFYVELGGWAEANGVKGKMSVVPVAGGIAAVDDSLGEYAMRAPNIWISWLGPTKMAVDGILFNDTTEPIMREGEWSFQV